MEQTELCKKELLFDDKTKVNGIAFRIKCFAISEGRQVIYFSLIHADCWKIQKLKKMQMHASTKKHSAMEEEDNI